MTDVTTVEQPTPLIVEETNKRDWPAFQIEIMKNLLAGMSAMLLQQHLVNLLDHETPSLARYTGWDYLGQSVIRRKSW